ncbi:mitofilin family membrane protein [Magnetospirillum aberrantis]|uniref:Uncharacterized protein n=1 Tax=Magnetospirillum aberrantis SpK TaxID=908842 RepID=A0A7C9QS87_9PROT|nr:hypothetical protein [Magnetospirillum aberrantis SpK]
METVVENSGEAAVPEKKSRSKSLPSVDAEQVASAEVNTEAAQPLVEEPVAEAAPEVEVSSEAAALQAQLAKAVQTARIGLGVAAVALVLAVTSPWWGPRTVDNELSTRQTVVLAAAQVKTLAAQDAPFAEQFALISRALPADKATKGVVATIAPLAQAGVPTLAALQESFKGTADRVLVGQMVGKDDESWVSWSLHKVAALVRVETVTSTVATPPADVQIVHDANIALDEGNLALAVEHLSQLEGNAADEVQGWVADAKNRVALDEAVTKLGTLAESRSKRSAWLWFR